MKEVISINIESEKPWWVIFVDIEGYSAKEQAEGRALSLSLADDICRITLALPGIRLGSYQFGADGFLITQQGISNDFSLSISISVALMRMALKYNSIRKVKISYGNLGDYSDFYKNLHNKYNGSRKDDCISINQSVIVLAPALMGDGLIKAHKLPCNSGPLICIDKDYKTQLDKLNIPTLTFTENKSLTINWLPAFEKAIEDQIDKFVGNKLDWASLYKTYLEEECTNLSPDCEWLNNAKSLLK